MADELPISLNSMDDEALKAFVDSPSAYLEGVDREVVPSPFTPATKDRIGKLLQPKGLSAEDIARRIDIMAMVKIKNVEVID